MTDKVIITCAVTGAIHTPTMSDHLPITPDEIAEGGAHAIHHDFDALNAALDAFGKGAAA